MAHRLKSYMDDFARREFCELCSAEGPELTTDCPGSYVAPATRADVARKCVDYRGGHWVRLNPSTGEIQGT